LKNSRDALIDLRPATSGSLIGWLNNQPHPNINYYSIIRQSNADEIVPAHSQDLNQVPALQGRSNVYLTSAGHALNAADGKLFADILSH